LIPLASGSPARVIGLVSGLAGCLVPRGSSTSAGGSRCFLGVRPHSLVRVVGMTTLDSRREFVGR